MDLLSAKVEAAAQSKRDKTTLYVVSHPDGECLIETKEPSKAGDVLQATFVNGAEEKEAPVTTTTKGQKITPVTKKENSTKTNKSNTMKAEKKAAKKSAPKAKNNGEKNDALFTFCPVALFKTSTCCCRSSIALWHIVILNW